MAREKRILHDITQLRANISRHGRMYSKILGLFYKDLPDNEIIRTALHLSLIGIICSTVFDSATLGIIGEELRPNHDQISLKSKDAWESMDQASKDFILKWIQNFHHIPSVLEEALLSMNLWYLVLRVMSISIENNSTEHTNFKLECVPKYKTLNVKAIGANFLTDIVFQAGSSGLPLFMVEIGAALGETFPTVHKDFKKLATQMGGVLLQLIGAIRTRGDEVSKSFSQSLRVFGALIYGTKIQFCVSRPQIETDGGLFIVFETHPQEWTFDLFGGEVGWRATSDSLATTTLAELSNSIMVESADSGDIKNIGAILTDMNIKETEINRLGARMQQAGSAPSDEVPYDHLNIDALSAITNFVAHIHSYHENLPNSVKEFYHNPGEPDRDLVLSDGINDCLRTSSKRSITARRQELYEYYTYLVHFDAPKIFLLSTLPLIRYTAPTSSEFWRWDAYLEGESLSDSVAWNDSHAPYEYLSENRVLLRGRFLLGITMAIYKAHQAGFVFIEFDCDDDIVFRDEVCCMKTYRHLQSVSSASAPSISCSLKLLSRAYYSYWFIDTFMTGGDEKYQSLYALEWAIFGKIYNVEFEAKVEDWKKMFEDAAMAYTAILEQIDMCDGDKSTILLKLILKELIEMDASAEVQVPLILQVYTPPLSQSLGSNDSSVEETEAKTGEDHL